MYTVNYWNQYKKKNKYNAVRTQYNGINYHSKFEAKVAEDLDWRIKAGEIKSWDRQVKISLDAYGRHICNYYIDFIAWHPDGTKEYIEVKGFQTEIWRLKWKIFEAMINENEPDAILTIIR